MANREELCSYYINQIKDKMERVIDGTVLVNGIDYKDIIAMQEFTDNGMVEYEDSLDRHILKVIQNGKTQMILDVPSESCSRFLIKMVRDLAGDCLCDILQGHEVYDYASQLFVKDGDIYRLVGKGYFTIDTSQKSDPIKVNTQFFFNRDSGLIEITINVSSRFSSGGQFDREYSLDKESAIELVGKSREDIVRYFLNKDNEYQEFASKFEDGKLYGLW